MAILWLQLWLQSKRDFLRLDFLSARQRDFMTSVFQTKWWLAGADLPAPEGPIPAIGHQNCNHKTYRLNCGQYNRMLARAAGRCEICGLRDYENAHGRLWIDHDHGIGDWAVRGLVCRRCNILLGNQLVYSEPMQAFIDNAFHLRLTAEAGFASHRAPEPPMMTALADHSLRTWRREPEGWWPLNAHQNVLTAPVTWSKLLYMSGPHNLRPTTVDPDFPLMAPLHRQRLFDDLMYRLPDPERSSS